MYEGPLARTGLCMRIKRLSGGGGRGVLCVVLCIELSFYMDDYIIMVGMCRKFYEPCTMD